MEETITYGALSLIPVSVVILTAILTKRALEPLLLGSLVGFAILSGKGFIVSYLDALYIQLGESAYFILIFGLFGIYIKLLEESKAIDGFTRWGMKFAKTKKKTAILTWAMGMILFLDNYFSILGAGVSSRKLADQNKMSREMFSFAVNAVACATCVLIPLSLWGVFMQGTIDDLHLLDVSGLTAITKAVPFLFFPWISIIMVLLYQFRLIPLFGPMKKAEARVETTGEVLPYDDVAEEHSEEEIKGNILNFLAPMIALIVTTLVTSELLYGLLVGIAVCFLAYIIQGLIRPGKAFDLIGVGFQDMFIVTAIVISAFVLQQANVQLDLATYVIDCATPVINVALLPAIAFLILLLLGFITGSFWGMMAVCFPIMIPLAQALDANLYLTIGAVIGGAAAGSTTCFYGDSVTLTCGITGVKNIDYARTALPLIVPTVLLSTIAYLIAGFVFAAMA